MRPRLEAVSEADRTVRVAGRIVAIRSFGKAAFLRLSEGSGTLQVHIRRDVLPERDFAVSKRVGPRGLCGGRRPHVPDPNGGTDRSRRLPRLPGEGPPAAPREVARPCRPGHPLPAALPGPARESADPRGVPPPGRDGFVDAPLHGRRGFSGSRDADAPAARHRGGGAAVPDPASSARDRPLPPGGARALPEAPRGRGVPAGLRDQPELPQRGALHPAQPRVHHAGVLPGVQRLRRHDGSHRAPGDRRGRRRAVRRAGGLRGRGNPLRKALRPGFALRGHAGGAPRAGSRSRGRRPPVSSGPRGRPPASRPPAAGRRKRRDAAREPLRGACRAPPGAAHLRDRIPRRGVAALQGESGRTRDHRALRTLRRRSRDRERVFRTERPRRAGGAFRRADGEAPGRRRTRHGLGLHRGPPARPPADRGSGVGGGPGGDAAHELGGDPGRDPVPAPPSRGKESERREASDPPGGASSPPCRSNSRSPAAT